MSLLDRMGRRAELCAAMLRQMELDMAEVSRIGLGTRMQSIARTCMLCRHSDECAEWLQSAAADATGYRRFCPNAKKLDGVREYLASTGRLICTASPKTV